MTILLKLLYAAAITTLFVLFIAFGIRTFYQPPEAPEFPMPPEPVFNRPPPATPSTEPQPTPTLTPAQEEYLEQQERFQRDYERYTDDLARYRVIVFAIASLVGVASVAGGVALEARLDALRLGLVGGGLGTLIYGVAQAGGDLDEAGTEVVFLIVAAGLVVIGIAGYRWLSAQEG